MWTEIFLFLVTALLAYGAYKWITTDWLYYEKRNIKYVKLGDSVVNFIKVIGNRFTADEFARNSYFTFEDQPIYGILDFGIPKYIVRDPDIIKKITIKDFDYFEDHHGFTDENTDKLWGNSLFLMKGQKWRQMRATLSPAFTGSKMRQMYELVSECAVQVVKHLKDRIDSGEKINLEMKDFFTRYTNDVIASCAFGFKVDSLSEPENEIYLIAKQLSNFSASFQMVKVFFIMLMPKLARALKIRFTDPTKFYSMVLDTMEYRKKKNIFRPDMINIMMQVRDGTLKYQAEDKTKEEGFATVEESEVGKATVNRAWNDDEIVAQCFIFIVAGFETTSNMLTFAAYELVANPDIQQKLYEEIDEMNKQLEGKRIGYDGLQKMKYLDQFTSEVLRKWPPFIQPDRLCAKDYEYDDGVRKFVIEKGSDLFIPVYGIQHDPQYYPDPEKFDPDRFNDENKDTIIPGSYIPFGIGPRNCIGSRFALMEIKAILYYLLLNYTFEPNEKTDLPLKLKETPFSPTMKNGMHLELKPRSQIDNN